MTEKEYQLKINDLREMIIMERCRNKQLEEINQSITKVHFIFCILIVLLNVLTIVFK